MTGIRKCAWLGAGLLLALAGPAALARPGKAVSAAHSQDRDPYLAMNRALVAHGCQLCHGADYARVGPAMKDVAAVYAANGAQGRAQLRESILKGTSGHWGPAVMPAQRQVGAAQADALVKIIMATR